MHRSNMRKRFLPFLVVFVALTAIMMTVAFAEGEAEYMRILSEAYADADHSD